jgi:hypothetical protein
MAREETVKFIPVEPKIEAGEPLEIVSREDKVVIVNGTQGSSREPVYDNDGKLIGHNDVTVNLVDEPMTVTVLTLSNGHKIII